MYTIKPADAIWDSFSKTKKKGKEIKRKVERIVNDSAHI
jgi:hypothetical protein